MEKQKVWWGIAHRADLEKELQKEQVKKIMLVCGKSYEMMKDKLQVEHMGVEVIPFSEFHPNPGYESVSEGIQKFSSSGCEAVLAVGGGSALDVAKCIKLYAYAPEKWNTFSKEVEENGVKLYAVPTTAGSGSEATSFAVIYKDGVKYSIENDAMLFDGVLFCEAFLDTLPLYQKKSTMLDALCHAVESYWSIHSTVESRRYAKEALHIILGNMNPYIAETGNQSVNREMLRAAHLAGKAIQISKTTAGHALSYTMSSIYGIAHGHAAALCVESVWRHLLQNLEQCVDKRGKSYLSENLEQISRCFGGIKSEDGPDKLKDILQWLGLAGGFEEKPGSRDRIVDSVNLERLKNMPIVLDRKDLYHIVQKMI